MAAMKRRSGGAERGAEIIELAMVTPILLLILGGIVDFGFLFRTWEVVTNAAREGARVGVLPDYSCTSGAGSDVESRVNDYLAGSGVTGATTAAALTTVAGFTSCTVTVSVNQPLPSLGIFGKFFGGNLTTVLVAGGASMRTESQAP